MSETPLLTRHLKGALAEAKVIPLWATAPSFPFEKMGSTLASLFEKQRISIRPTRSDWVKPADILSGMGENPKITPIALSPLPGELFWILPKKSFDAITSSLLSSEDMGFADSAMRSGFYRVALLSALDAFNKISPYRDLSANLASHSPLPTEHLLSIDLSITIDEITLVGRLLIPAGTQASFRTLFTAHTAPLQLDEESKQLPVPLHFTVGSTHLSAAEWLNTQVGDFILLDRCTYGSEEHKGRATLTISTAPLFDIRIKGKEVKILEFAYTQEESSMSAPNPPPKGPNPPHSSGKGSMRPEDPLWEPERPGAEKESSLLSKKEIPIELTVEVARIHMPLEKVAKLTPGSVLDLGAALEEGVYLTIGGKRVAKGELVKLGDALGVKILSLGD